MLPVTVTCPLVLAGICVYATGNHFALALHRPFDFTQLWFAGMCCIMVGFGINQAIAYQTHSLPAYVTVLKWNVGLILAFFMMFPWFISRFTGIRPLPWLIGLTTLSALLLALNSWQPYSLQFVKIYRLEPVHLPWGETIIEPLGRIGVWFLIGVALFLANIVFALYALTVAWRRERALATLAMLVAVVLFLLTAIEGILVRATSYHFIHLGPIGLLLMVAVMSLATAYSTREKLFASEQRFRALIEQSPFSIQVLAPDGRTRQVNPAWSRLWGSRLDIGEYNIFRDQQLIAKGVMPLVKQGFAGKIVEIPPIAYNPVDTPGVHAPTSERWVRAYIYPIINDGGVISDVILMHEDVTEKIWAEEEKESLREQFVQAQKMESVGRLATGVAHDFNNYLSAIIGYSELELIKRDPADPLREKFRVIYDAGSRAAELTRQLLGLSRKQVLQMSPLSLNEVVTDMLHMLRRTLGEDISVKEDLQATGTIKADRAQLEQIIMNLAVNARDAMPRGGDLIIATGDAELESRRATDQHDVEPGRYVALAITDTGVGISAEMKEKIFEPFFTTKQEDKGTGLGLAMVQGIVKQHGGHIRVVSDRDKGTTFKLFFPVTTEPALPIRKKERAALPRGTQTILVVDDEAIIRQLAIDTLEELGYTCLGASSGDEAVRAAENSRKPIDLLLTDVLMPGMNGKELSDHLRQSRPAMKTVYISGYTADTITHHGILDSGVAYLAKPVTPTTLAFKLHEVLEHE